MARITIVIEDDPENVDRPVSVQMDFDPPLLGTPDPETPAQRVASMAFAAMVAAHSEPEEP